MYFLFKTTEKNLSDAFKLLSNNDIRDWLDFKIYNRGLDYYKSGNVSDIAYNQEKTQLTATVYGNEDYKVDIQFKDGEIHGSCTCPYEDICKHQAAVLLYAINKAPEIDITEQEDSNNQIRQYLKSLSKDELISLVEKFAPQQFYIEIRNRNANVDVTQKTLQNVNRNIQKLFENESFLYSYNAFSDALDKEIRKLSGLEKAAQKEIEDLLFYIMNEVDNAFDEGYLYDDYNDGNYYPSSYFDEFVSQYVTGLENETKMSFIEKLDKLLSEQSYDTFQHWIKMIKSTFGKEDLPGLKNVLMKTFKNISHQLVGEYYDHVSGLLSFEEKETILGEIMQNNSVRLIELVKLYDSRADLDKAIKTLDSWLKNKGPYARYEDVYSLYLDFLQKGKFELSEVSKVALSACPSHSMLKKIISMVHENPAEYEKLLEEKNAGEFLKYLENEKRLPDALLLIKRVPKISDYQQYDFFKKHKTIFPTDAEKYFNKVIDKNLKETGDRYYEAVAEAIQHLSKINLTLTQERLADIRINYKRRRNLILMLERF